MTRAVLIIADSEDDQRLYRRALKSHDYSLESAENAETGLAIALKIKPCLILLDYRLPDCDGLEFMKKLNTSIKTPVIMLTGQGDTSVAVEAMKTGASDYIIKDIQGDFLRILPVAIEKVLKQKALEESFREAEKIGARLMNHLHATLDFVGFTDAKGQVTYINPAGRALVGIGENEDVTQLNIADIHTTAARQRLQDVVIPTVIRDGIWQGETTFQRRDGQETPILMVIIAHKSDSGEVEAFSTISINITENKLTEEKLRKSLLEKEMLMREIDHRAKNNMQIISSLIRMQMRDANDARFTKLIQDLGNRITAMNIVHDKAFHAKHVNQINTSAYFTSLVNNIQTSYGENHGRIKLNIDTGNISLNTEISIHCGLIINELVSNSIKHAFAPEQKGVIDIVLQPGMALGNIELIVRDNGLGLNEDIDIRNVKSMGMRLVIALAEHQLNGKIELNRNHGTEFKIVFPAIK